MGILDGIFKFLAKNCEFVTFVGMVKVSSRDPFKG